MGHQIAVATFAARHAALAAATPIRGLVIEDDDALRELLCSLLGALGIEARGVDREQGVDELLARRAVHVVDASKGGDARAGTGTPRLRMAPGNGLVLLTTRESSDADGPGPAGRDGGTPVKLPALEQLVGNLRRRLSLDAVPAAAGDQWTYDAARWKLIAPNGRSVQLSPAESQVIRCLFERGGEVAGRDELLTALNRPHLEAYSRNLDVTVSRLRKKVESLCRQKLPLTSARSRGYAFYAPAAIVS